MTWNKFLLKLIGVYAPTQNCLARQVHFYNLLKQKIENLTKLEQNYLIVCGDMNLHMDALDTNSNKFRMSPAANIMKEITHIHYLTDVWRSKHRDLRRYSWRRLAPLQLSSLDYIFASEYLLNNHVLKCVNIKHGIQSDHSLVNIEIAIFADGKGPGLFRFRNEMLQDEIFVTSVKDEIQKVTQGDEMYNDATSWV